MDYGNSMKMATQHTVGGSDVPPVLLITEHSLGVTGIRNLTLSSDGTLHSDQDAVKLGFDAQVLIVAKVAGN